MKKTNYQHYSACITELVRLTREKYTGAFVIHTKSSDKGVAMFHLDGGEIVFIYMHGKRGQDAMPMIRDIEYGELSYKASDFGSIRIGLPETRSILDYLTEKSTASDKAIPRLETLKASNENNVKKLIVSALTEFIGPMSKMLCNQYLTSPSSYKKGIIELSRVIPNEDNRKRFTSEANELINGAS